MAHIETGELLKVEVPYDQVWPHKTSDLHTTKLSLAATTSDLTKPDYTPINPNPGCFKPTCVNQTCLDLACFKSLPASNQPASTKTASTKPTTSTNLSSYNGEEIIDVGEVKAKKRKASAVLKKNVAMLLQGIESGAWIVDEQIDRAQAMLANQFSNIGCLQTVCVFEPEGCQRVGTPENNFVQILNVSGNHWITVSDIGCLKDTAVVYDSLHCANESSYRDKFLRQMAYMLMPRSRHMTLLTADIQKQEGTSDCGLFTVTVATSLCCGVVPQDNSWKQSEMHKHLARCFKEGVLREFPRSSRSRDHQCYFDSKKFEFFFAIADNHI